MKYSPIAQTVADYRKSAWVPLAAACGWLALAGGSQAAELLSNRQFDQVLVDWTVPQELAPWIPYNHPAGTVSLNPSVGGYMGTLLRQSLNVTGIAGQTVNGSIDLGAEWALSAGNTYVIYVAYLDDTGAKQRGALIRPANTAIPVGSMATFTGNFTFPANAAKMVGLELDRETWGEADADNLSLTSPTLTAGPVPHLGEVLPLAVAYGQSFTITGTGFGGATAPEVLLNGAPDGMQVTGWTDTSITVAVSAPAASGTLEVTAGGTPACERRQVEISSPHCMMKLAESTFHTIPGVPVELPVWVDMRGGYSPAGGVQFQVMKGTAPVSTVSTPAVTRSGGAIITIPTGSLTAGANRLTIRPTGDGFTGADSFFDVFLEMPASARFTKDGATVTGTLNLTAQGSVSFIMTLLDAGGVALTYQPTFVWTSSNPAACDVFLENRPWGGPQLLVNADGDAVIHANGPAGLHYELPVHVDVPTSPQMTGFEIGVNPISNSGEQQNTLLIQLNVPIHTVSWGVSDMGFAWGDSNWGSDGMSYYATFKVNQGALPGAYLFYGSGSGMTRKAKVWVVNDPGKGMVSGRVVSFSGGGEMHMQEQIHGTLEFYDAAGTKVTPGVGDADMSIFEWGKEYHASYLDPGVYRMRWVPDMGGSPQWWPNANTFAEAAPVTVAAGGVTPGISFFIGGTTATSPPTLAGPTAYNAASHTFGIPVQTISGVSYELQRSDSMREGTWFTVAEAWGDGNPQTLQDTTATGTKGFYRVLKK